MPQIILTTELSRDECVRRLRVAVRQRPKRALGRIGARSFTLTGRPRWYGRRAFWSLRLRGRFVQPGGGVTQIACDTGSAWTDLLGALVAAVLVAALSGLIAHRSLEDDAGFACGFFLASCVLIFVRRVLVRPSLLRGEGATLLGLVKAACVASEA
jgi:hypothetical protein